MKEFQLCGLGNALVDIFVDLSEEEFTALGFERGSMRLVEAAEQKLLLARFKDREPRLVSGGSVANSIRAEAPRSSAASATTVTACSTRPSSTNSTSISATRSSSTRPRELVPASSRRTPSARCASAWRSPATWRPDTLMKNASRTRTGSSSKATCSPTRRPARGRSVKPCAWPRNTASRWPSPAQKRSSSTSSATPSARPCNRPTCFSATPPRPVP